MPGHLVGAHSMAVHPNGRDVYVASTSASTLRHFRRDGDQLRFVECFGAGGGCTPRNSALAVVRIAMSVRDAAGTPARSTRRSRRWRLRVRVALGALLVAL
jgi:hypothetical protein